MPFPIEYSGEIKWNSHLNPTEKDRNLFVNTMAGMLSYLGSTRVTVQEETIWFEGPELNRFGSGSNVLLAITTGEIKTRVVNNVLVVSYYLNFRKVVFFATVSLSAAAIVAVISTRDLFPVAPVTLAWFLAVGMNYWFTANIRFPRLIRQVLQSM